MNHLHHLSFTIFSVRRRCQLLNIGKCKVIQPENATVALFKFILAHGDTGVAIFAPFCAPGILNNQILNWLLTCLLRLLHSVANCKDYVIYSRLTPLILYDSSKIELERKIISIHRDRHGTHRQRLLQRRRIVFLHFEPSFNVHQEAETLVFLVAM